MGKYFTHKLIKKIFVITKLIHIKKINVTSHNIHTYIHLLTDKKRTNNIGLSKLMNFGRFAHNLSLGYFHYVRIELNAESN